MLYSHGIAVEIKWINPGKILFLEIPNEAFCLRNVNSS